MMDPFKNGEDHEPLQVLRLHKWTQAPLSISSFKEASLSPCRDIISLHSKDGELMLVPLRSVSQTIPGIPFVPPPPPPPTVNAPNTTSQTKGSSRLVVAGHSITPGPVTSPYEGEVLSSNGSSSMNTRHFPFIADAISYCWGCNGDGHCTDKHVVLFRELLFVVGSEGLFVHAFARETSKQESSGSLIHSVHREQGPESFVRGKKRTVSGRWMNWGRVDTDPSSITGDHFPGNGSMERNFITCLMDAQVQKSAAGIELNFVGDFHMPNRRIVSFNISYQSLAFSALAELCEEYQWKGPGSSTPIPEPGTEGQFVNSNFVQAYKFSKVFAGPSYDVLGMMLLKRDLADNALKDHGEGKLFILICKVLHSGLVWSSVVEPGQGVTYHRADHWATFTISRTNLIGLHEKGIACIWSLSDGKILVEVDVLQHCGLSYTDIEGTCPTHQTDLSEQDTSAWNTSDAKGTQKSQNRDVLPRQSYVHSKSFTQLAVDADCSLLSVMDSSGIVYLVSTKSYLSGSPQCKGVLPYERSSTWGVAAADIGSHLPVSYLAPDSRSKDIQRKKPGNRILGSSGGYLSSCSSGFSSKLDLTRAGLHTARFMRDSCQPLRNIILPVSMAARTTLSLSRLGITQMLQFEDKDQSSKLLIFRMLCLPGKFYDDNKFNLRSSSCVPTEEELDRLQDGKVIIFHSQGCLHYVSEVGLYVVLPPWSLHTSQQEAVLQGRWWFTGATSKCSLMDLQFKSCNKKEGVLLQDWQLDILDKVLIYDGLNAAEHLAVENGWCQQVVRLRRLQLALHYSQLDEIEQALDGLVPVGAAEIGVPRLLFAALELMLNKCGGDNELGLASRLLYLAAQFATKLIYQYGARMTGEKAVKVQEKLSKKLDCSLVSHQNYGKNLQEMSRYLEIIRKLQNQLQLRRSPQPPGKKDTIDDNETDGISNDKAAGSEEAVETGYSVVSSNMDDLMWLVKSGAGIENQAVESSGEMFYRWQKQKVELSDIVREALKVGRLPLAVVQLHRLQLKDFTSQAQRQNAFKEVQGIGRAFVYDLFCKGETSKAMTVLSRLGEDPETVLHELAFGTLSRYLRSQVVRELARLDCLNSQDIQLLETVSVLERAYPNSSFWGSYGAQQRLLPAPTGNAANESPTNIKLQITCSLKAPMDLVISCGEVDGVVLGCWDGTHDVGSIPSVMDEAVEGYWAAAAVWLTDWGQKTLDRVILDQATRTGDDVSWEAHLQNAISRHDWAEVSSLLDWIPGSVLQEGELRVRLDCSDKLDLYVSQLNAERDLDERGSRDGQDGLEVDSVDLLIPRVKLLAVSLGNACTGWMYQMMEEKLAQKFIFLCSNWHGTSNLTGLLARAGMLFENLPKLALYNRSSSERRLYNETTQAVHELVLHHCVQHSLPNLMGIYLDHHSLARDNVSSVVMQAVVGDCQWALWLLFSRIKGREYDASFANARTILAHNFSPQQLSATVDVDDFILTVDDMVMVGGEMMALSTLMYAPVPLEKCLCTGSVNRHDGPTWQCTLENLRPGLQQFPTLWCTVVAACFSPDMWCFTTSSISSAASIARKKMGLAGYLQWREQLFSSACGDTSLLQMLPRWYPKGVRRLLQLAVQGPVGGGQSLIQGGNDLVLHSGMTMNDLDPMSWESSVQKSIEEELYASSKIEDNAKGVEHHLRRGRAMAAFNALLGLRLQNLSAQGSMIREHVGKFQRGQMHMASDMHAVLSPLTLHEEKFLASVLPLAVVNFENPVVVAACASFLELCGLPATMLRIDIAALCRISVYCKAKEQDVLYGTGANASLAEAQDDWPNFCRNDITSSLARALADEYVETGVAVLSLKKSDVSGKRLSAGKLNRTLSKILQMLEKASYMELPKQESTPGLWLLNGIGDGPQLRAQQREVSERWSLVTTFCNVHQLPISTVYLAALARDNDWVGFLAEAQLEGCPLDMLISVATSEFTDTRLRSHILTVLKSSQAAWQKQSPLSTTPSALPFDRLRACAATYRSELFDILADCEHKRHPGTALLLKAKDLRWPLLAVVASCFSDTTPVSCLTVWLEITAARETSLIKVNDAAAHIAACVGAAVEATNLLTNSSHPVEFRYNRKISKRRCFSSPEKTERDLSGSTVEPKESPRSTHTIGKDSSLHGGKPAQDPKQKPHYVTNGSLPHDGLEEQESLSRMIAILCEQKLFFPLLKAFELFMPSSPLLPFIRFLQAFSQMRLSEASAHLTSFTASLKEESHQTPHVQSRNRTSTAWISTAAVTAADTMLTTCPSAYECRCLLQLLAGADFGDGGVASARFRHLYWKIQLAEPAFQQGTESVVMGVNLDDNELLLALEKHGKWEEARSWARQLEITGHHGKAAMHHVTETQAEVMVAEWKEYVWDIPEERMALWNHCQTLFMRFSFPPLQAGSFFLKHAEAIEQEISPAELHGILLLALQWLSGSITHTSPVYPLHLLRELETRIWLLAVESQVETLEGGGRKSIIRNYPVLVNQKLGQDVMATSGPDYINLTAKAVAAVDNHLKNSRLRSADLNTNERDNSVQSRPSADQDHVSPSATAGGVSKLKRRPKNYALHKRIHFERSGKLQAEQEGNGMTTGTPLRKVEPKGTTVHQEEPKEDPAAGEDQIYWEERVGEQELERAVLSLLEVGQVSAARQLQQKLAPAHVPMELLLAEAALSMAMISMPTVKGSVDSSTLHPSVTECLLSSSFIDDISAASPLELLEALTKICREGCGRGICKRIIAIARVAEFLEMSFSEAFEKQPTQLLQLLSLKAQDSFAEATLLVETHSMPAASIARILAESFLKGLLAAHRGGYMESSLREEGPAPLLWRPSDLLKWAKLCPSEPELGHALMRIVISGHDVPHACEVELLILAHHFYMSSACLDGIDVLLALAATRVESYISEADFASLARLVTGINNFQALHFMLDILIENGQLELLLQKRAAVEAAMESSASVRGFRMAVLSTLKHFNPHDLDAFAMVYDQFDMKHEMARLLESRARKVLEQWLVQHDPEQSEYLLEMMCFNVEAAEVWSGVDAGNKARWNCAQASLISLQLRMPEIMWLSLSDTNARRLFVEQSRFQEALVVAEAYKLNQPGEWVPVLWNQMLHPGFDQFLGEFVAALPLPPSMLMELARFYRAEVTARGDQLDFSTWLSPGVMPLEWARFLGKSFRCLLKYVRDVRLRVQLATLATGFSDVLDVCMRILDKVPETAGPLIVRKGHGGTYLPLM